MEFENDLIDQDQLFQKFFADGRQFDGHALVAHMVRALQGPVVDSALRNGFLHGPVSADCTSPMVG